MRSRSLESIVVASIMYALAGDFVAEQLTGVAVGSFRTYLLDRLSGLDSKIVQEKARVERVDKK